MFTGKVSGQFADEFPFPVTRDVLERGHDRFNVYCSPCHGRTADGQRDDRAARPQAAAVVPRRQDSDAAGRLLLRRHDQRIRRHAGLPHAARARRTGGRSASYIRALQVQPARPRVADVPSDKRGELDTLRSTKSVRPPRTVRTESTEAMTDSTYAVPSGAARASSASRPIVGVVGLGLCAFGFTGQPRAVLSAPGSSRSCSGGACRSARWRG